MLERTEKQLAVWVLHPWLGADLVLRQEAELTANLVELRLACLPIQLPRARFLYRRRQSHLHRSSYPS